MSDSLTPRPLACEGPSLNHSFTIQYMTSCPIMWAHDCNQRITHHSHHRTTPRSRPPTAHPPLHLEKPTCKNLPLPRSSGASLHHRAGRLLGEHQTRWDEEKGLESGRKHALAVLFQFKCIVEFPLLFWKEVALFSWNTCSTSIFACACL